jgi:hypothetical protein
MKLNEEVGLNPDDVTRWIREKPEELAGGLILIWENFLGNEDPTA